MKNNCKISLYLVILTLGFSFGMVAYSAPTSKPTSQPTSQQASPPVIKSGRHTGAVHVEPFDPSKSCFLVNDFPQADFTTVVKAKRTPEWVKLRSQIRILQEEQAKLGKKIASNKEKSVAKSIGDAFSFFVMCVFLGFVVKKVSN